MSTPHFHKLRVADIRQETPQCVSIAFHIPDELKAAYQFEAGQYITIKKVFEGEEIRRSYSLCSSPSESDFRIAVKQVEAGKFSTYACNELKIGDTLDVMTPMGNFTAAGMSSNEQHLMAFAAGSGITPVLSLMKACLEGNTVSKFTLVYGNQNLHSIIFKEEIEALKNKYMGRLQVVHILSRERLETEVNNGRINTEKCIQLSSGLIDFNSINHFFMCGPEDMIMSVKAFLIEKQIDPKHIHFELFTTGVQTKREDWRSAHSEDEGKMSTITIKVDDRTYDIKVAYSGENILDAALRSGADLPYACKGGVCCTCRAKVMEGEVAMEVNYALEPDEVENGFVLTCQSHPKTERVFIDFDAR